MLGFQPYETFQLLVESGGVDRTNTLLVAACDAYARRGKPMPAELDQFETLASRLFPLASPAARMRAEATMGQAESLSPRLEELVLSNIGDDLTSFLESAKWLSEPTLLNIAGQGDATAAAAISRRSDLTNVVLAKLFGMNSRKVYRALAANTSIAPRGAYLSALARSAQMDHIVAASLAERGDFDAALLAPAFFDLADNHRVKVIRAFSHRNTPPTPNKRFIEQISVATNELTRAMMKLFSENRRPEITRLLGQITGLDEVRCAQVAHDTSGAALFVVLRAFGCTSYDGLKVLIHATSHDGDRSKSLSDFARMFESVSVASMGYLMSAWRGEVNLLDLSKPEYRPFTEESSRTQIRANTSNPVIDQAIEALSRIGARKAG